MSRPATRRRSVPVLALALAAALGLAACGDGGTAEEDVTAAVESAAEAVVDATSDAEATESLEEMAEEMADSLEARQDAQGGGSARLTAGDETWTFDSVLCAFGEEETGQEGAEFVLSSIQDGLQFYVSIDDFGHSVSLNDIEDFENPSVSLSSEFGAGEFITLDGKNAGGEMTMTADDGSGAVQASFEAVCP
jgi:hypothetical protein